MRGGMRVTKDDCESLRRRLKVIADEMRLLFGADGDPETLVNIGLAYRHLEDCSMRLGKAIQVIDGGVSVYDKTQVPDAPPNHPPRTGVAGA